MNTKKFLDDTIDYGKQAIADKNGWLSGIRDTIRLWLPIKILLAFLGALTGASILGFLSEYAAYSYALQCGIRPPLEGIPYLRASVTAGGFLLSAMGLTFYMTFALYLNITSKILANALLKMINRIQKLRGENQIQIDDLPLVLNPPIEGTARKCIIIILAIFTGVLFAWYPLPWIEKYLGIDREYFELLTRFFCVSSISVGYALIKKYSIWLLSFGWTALVLLILIASILRPSVYASLLRHVGYGGGIRVKIEQMDTDSTNDYALLLRTSEAFIVRDEQKNEIIEIPNRNVRTISHQTGGLSNLPFSLPWMATSKVSDSNDSR
jgi:hypothetical protein